MHCGFKMYELMQTSFFTQKSFFLGFKYDDLIHCIYKF